MTKHSDRGGSAEAPGATRVPASEVKNAWHAYVDRVSQAREEIVVTRYGRAVMKLSPIEEEEDRRGIFGFLVGTLTVHGDIVGATGEAWDADG